MTTIRLFTEVEAAYVGGFKRFRDFRRAVRTGCFPRPDVDLPDGPRWSEALLRRWLGHGLEEGPGAKEGRSVEEQERELLERIRRHAW